MGLSVVVLQRDLGAAQALAGELLSHFRSVDIARSRDDLRETVADSHPQAVVLDLEFSQLADVQSLRHAYPALPIVCTHRVPDEEMWAAALEAGATDFCASDDVQSVLTSVLRNLASVRPAAA
jgi:chemotaxis response regulator CheB